jgi:uncharacterized membrane protein
LDEVTKAKALLVLLALVWGLSWPIMTIALAEISVWTLRVLGFSLSALSLFALIRLQGRSAAIPRGVTWLHIVAASMFNVVGFGLFSSFALLASSTSRVVIVNYSMPIWASLMAWLILGERLSIRAGLGLVLCISGLTVLIYPVATAPSAVGLLLALCCALSWAAGTVYMKWARIAGDLLAITAWQIALGALVFGAGAIGISRNAGAGGCVAQRGSGGGLQWSDRDRFRLHPVVRHYRAPADRNSLARFARDARRRRLQLDSDARRTADGRGHDRLCADLCRRAVRADAAGTADSGAGAVSVLAKPRPPRPLDREGHPPLGDGGCHLFVGTLGMRTETPARPNSSCEPRPAR